jgi:predicted RecB family nuclease
VHAVTGSLVYNYFSHPCSYRVHLDLTADRDGKSPPTPAGQYLMERGNRYERIVFDGLKAEHAGRWIDVTRDPDLPHDEDLARRCDATLAAMRDGRSIIFHGVLRAGPTKSAGFTHPQEAPHPALAFRGEADVLVRVEQPSPVLGAHSYVVGDVKSSHHASFAQKMQVTFYSWILEDLQGTLPQRGFIINGLGEREDFAVADLLWTLRPFVEEEVFEHTDPARAFFHLEPRCSGCHWHSHCSARAQAEDDLSLIPNCSRSAKRALQIGGIKTRARLKAAGDDELRGLGRAFGNRLDGFRDLQKLASAQDFKRPVMRQHPRTALARAPQHADATPDVFRHRGSYLLVTGIFDGTSGREAVMGTTHKRRDELLGRTVSDASVSYFEDEGADRASLLLRLLAHKHEIETLLGGRREPLLVVLADGAIQHRLRHAARALEPRRRGMVDMVERLLTDCVVLTDIVDRTYYLPCDARRVLDVAAALAPAAGGTAFGRRSPFEPAAGVPAGPDDAHAAKARLTQIAADYGLDLERVFAPKADCRAIFVREWQTTRDRQFAQLVRFEVAEELRAAESVLGHLLRLVSV